MSPGELTTRDTISVLVDIAAGSVVLAVAIWSILALRDGRGDLLPDVRQWSAKATGHRGADARSEAASRLIPDIRQESAK